jgi:salicylate hydroxylase
MRVLIAGGGIGGLTAALCCLHFGYDVTIFEQAPELGEVGAGIQLPPNAMKVFEALEIDGLMAESAFRPEAIEARMGESGRHIFNIPLAYHAIEKWGSPYLHIHRADYIKALKQALTQRAPQALRLGVGVADFRQDDEGVTVSLKNGTEVSGDILIGADGIKSIIREKLFGADKAQFTGNVAWRAVVPKERLASDGPNSTACAWMGRGRHAVTYWLRGGKLVNFVGVVERDDWRKEGWTERGNLEDALRDFEGWHPTITDLIKAVEPGSLFRWALFDRAPLSNWSQSRVTLLGDAAHPMLPFLAQGAAMAVEDSWALAREISKRPHSVPEALLAYQSLRHKRTAKVQAASRANMKTFHQATRLGQLKTYGPMWLAGQLFPMIVHGRMNWLYGFDVTSDKS